MMSSGAFRTPNRRGEGGRLRAELLVAAQHLVDADGADALSLRAVARGAGVSAPSVYRHFIDLGDLISSVISQCFEELIEEICAERDSVRDVEGQLLASARGYLRYAEQFPGRYALIFGRPSSPRSAAETLAPTSSASSERAFSVLVDAVSACLRDQPTGAGNASDIATAIWVGLDGFANLRVQRPHFPWPELDTMLGHLVLHHVSPAGKINNR